MNFENINKDDFLQLFWQYRDENGVIQTADFNEELEEAKEKRQHLYAKLIAELTKNIADKKQLKDIIGIAEEYNDKYNIEQAIYYKQYYKTGMKDSVRFIFQCLM